MSGTARQFVRAASRRRPLSRARTREALERLDHLLEAKIPVAEAVRSAAAMHGRSRVLLAGVNARMSRGERLSTALLHAGAALSPPEAAVLRAGERGGDLGAALHLLERHLQRQIASQRSIGQAAAYPIVLLLLAAVVLVFAGLGVLPAFARLYHEHGARLPQLSQTLLAFSGWFAGHAWELGVTLTLASASISVLRRLDRHRAGLLDRLALGLPLVGSAIRDRERVRFYGLAACLLKAGADLQAALSLAAPAVSNRSLRRRYRRLNRLVRSGHRPSAALSRSALDDDGCDRGLLEVAEAGGDYAASLERLAKLAEQRQAERVRLMVRLAEPAAVAVVSIAVGMAAVAIYQPILGSSSLLTATFR